MSFHFGNLWHLSINENLPLNISFRVIGSRHFVLWANILSRQLKTKNIHPDWVIFHAISSFAKRPTRSNLAEQITSISKLHIADIDSQLLRHYPWQFAACLSALIAGRPLVEIISCINSGGLGTEENWIDWEKQGETGIDIARFRFLDELNVTDDMQGAILHNSSWVISSHIDLAIVKEISRALRQWPEVGCQKHLLDACFYILYRATVNRTLQDANETLQGGDFVTDLIDACIDLELPLMDSISATVLMSPFSLKYKLTLLAKVGAHAVRFSLFSRWETISHEANNALEALILELLTCSNWREVLCALSYLPPLDAMRSIPQFLLDELTKLSEAYCRAAIVLRLYGLQWNVEDSTEMLHKSLKVAAEHGDFLTRLFDFVDLFGKSGLQIEAFVVELLNQPSDTIGAQLRSRAAALLVKLVERRPAISLLPDPNDCLKASSIS
jgi:hypothetical protein